MLDNDGGEGGSGCLTLCISSGGTFALTRTGLPGPGGGESTKNCISLRHGGVLAKIDGELEVGCLRGEEFSAGHVSGVNGCGQIGENVS